MMSEMYTEDLYGSDRNHGKVTGTPAIERLAQHLMDYEADFLKNWRVPPFYSETGEITNPNLSKEERLKKWETWARANLNIIGNRNRTVSYQYEGPMNSDERVMKEFLEKHVMTFADGPARLPQKLSSRKRRIGEEYTANESDDEIDIRASVGKKYVDQDIQDTIGYSSKDLQCSLDRGQDLIIPTGSFELVAKLHEKFPGKITLIGLDHLMRGYGNMLLGECDRYGIKAKPGDDAEKLLIDAGFDPARVKNRFWNQFAYSALFDQIKTTDPNVIFTDPSGSEVSSVIMEQLWESGESYVKLSAESASDAFSQMSLDAMYNVPPTSSATLEMVANFNAPSIEQIKQSHAPIFDPTVCPNNVTFDSANCYAWATPGMLNGYEKELVNKVNIPWTRATSTGEGGLVSLSV